MLLPGGGHGGCAIIESCLASIRRIGGDIVPASGNLLLDGMITDRPIGARLQRVAIAHVKQESSPLERQVGQCRDKEVESPRQSAPSRYLLIKYLSDDHADHLVQARIRAIRAMMPATAVCGGSKIATAAPIENPWI